MLLESTERRKKKVDEAILCAQRWDSGKRIIIIIYLQMCTK